MTTKTLITALSALAVDCADPAELGKFWQALLGGDLKVHDDGDVSLRTPVSGAPVLLFLVVPEGKTVKNRLHLDFDVADYDAAVERALSLGATRADDVYDGDEWQVMRDPEGNEFCLLRP